MIQANELTVKQFLLKKFPVDKYFDCPIAPDRWKLMQEYAEAYHKSISPAPSPSVQGLIEKWDHTKSNYNKMWDEATTPERKDELMCFIAICDQVLSDLQSLPSSSTVSKEEAFTRQEVLQFTQNMIMQYKFGNTNIEQMALLDESLPKKEEAQGEWIVSKEAMIKTLEARRDYFNPEYYKYNIKRINEAISIIEEFIPPPSK